MMFPPLLRRAIRWLAFVIVLGAPAAAAQELGPAPWLDPDQPALWRPRLQPFAVQIISAIDTSNRVTVRTAYNQSYVPPMPSMGWTGTINPCNPGQISAAFKDWTISRVNYIRAMAGLPGNITLNDTNSAKAQQAALMMSANQQLSHTPPTTWTCYASDGAEAAGKSNLGLAFGSSSQDDVVPRYIDDSGSNNAAVGHRRWILYPPQTNMGVGSTPSTQSQWGGNALWVLTGFGARPPTPNGVPWPPRGFVPLALFPSSNRWSFSFPNANFSAASVAMYANGASIPVTVDSRADNGFGDNTIVWRPTLTVTKGSIYDVTIGGVTGSGVPTTFTYSVIALDPAEIYRVRSDTNGDGKSDMVLRHATGTNYIWHIDGTSITNSTLAISSQGYLPGLDTSWSIAGTGDFNGDGKGDVLLRHTNGTLYVWHLDGTNVQNSSVTILTQGYLPGLDSSWTIEGIGDFNGDGKSDILLRHANGTVYVWHLNGASIVNSSITIASQGYLPPLDSNWTIAGIGDFNGDGKSDLMLRHANGTNYIWNLNGASIVNNTLTIHSQGYLPALDASWSVAGIGDFNGDGKSDLLLRDASGTNYVWHLNGASISAATVAFVSHGYLPGLDTSWSVAATGDFNGDGKADVLWRHSSGTNYVWQLDGASITAGSLAIPTHGYLPSLEPGWSVVRR